MTGIKDDSTEMWDTWLVGAPNFGVNTVSNILAAVAADLNGDGIFNDAPSDPRCQRRRRVRQA